MFGLNNQNYWACLWCRYPYLTLSLFRKVTILLLLRGKAEGLLCPPLLGPRNLVGVEAVHASGLALAFGSELINPWLPELVFGCRRLPGSADRAGVAQR